MNEVSSFQNWHRYYPMGFFPLIDMICIAYVHILKTKCYTNLMKINTTSYFIHFHLLFLLPKAITVSSLRVCLLAWIAIFLNNIQTAISRIFIFKIMHWLSTMEYINLFCIYMHMCAYEHMHTDPHALLLSLFSD